MKIKVNLIENKVFLPVQIISKIDVALKFNNYYTREYLSLIKMICDEYHITRINNISPLTLYLFNKEYNIMLGDIEQSKLNLYENNHYSIEVHESTSIFRAIMDDNVGKIIFLAEQKEFDKNIAITSDFYPVRDYDFLSNPQLSTYNLLEICCYYGAVDCFKFLRTKFHLPITIDCLKFSFLSGVPDILNECLKECQPVLLYGVCNCIT
ncbi:hypothetical protein TVAG_084170 [Trichomonas vaginalis G3]|uniref:DUF3447 domain-containing protein n=1 Tax=Trichomonas vaginalis (strain ATCC PRA-98 / G3) TaxID=412133 RepID=A2FXG9_TRIV3|nr:spectrin binding [Trichomonas vaginalis G3]EAX90391.1 hypothetical protein TVAG_084170 [Trichomonas vaginalis G3]KAI5484090.1 spectrin binding [Trichomonas vaginalis G3]|eukprot:XP_001303321.1 hypothetical protein [Trichomonas vaginalis G3]